MAPVPSASTVYRILVRHGLVDAKARRRRREDYKRWERDAPMALWQLDIVGGVFLADLAVSCGRSAPPTCTQGLSAQPADG